MQRRDFIANTRLQLTLFIPEKDAAVIETIRRKYNPLQFDLIKAHVTVCREDELISIETIAENLSSSANQPLTIFFDQPARFADGKGLLIPGKGENKAFRDLRKTILKNITGNPRVHEPHITLMHPRNSTCTDSIFQQVENSKLPLSITFDKISLIGQSNGQAWKVLKEFIL